jgi:hypothetical protein
MKGAGFMPNASDQLHNLLSSARISSLSPLIPGIYGIVYFGGPISSTNKIPGRLLLARGTIIVLCLQPTF